MQVWGFSYKPFTSYFSHLCGTSPFVFQPYYPTISHINLNFMGNEKAQEKGVQQLSPAYVRWVLSFDPSLIKIHTILLNCLTISVNIKWILYKTLFTSV